MMLSTNMVPTTMVSIYTCFMTEVMTFLSGDSPCFDVQLIPDYDGE